MKNKFIFLLFLFLAIILSWIFDVSFANFNVVADTWIKIIDDRYSREERKILYLGDFEKVFEKYLEGKKDDTDRWITFMSILSTLFAVFFVYSSFKIDKDLKEMNEKAYNFLEKLEKAYNEKLKALNEKAEKEKEEIDKKNEEEKEELKRESEFIKIIDYYAKSISKKWDYEEAISWLSWMLEENYVLEDNDKYNNVLYYLSKAYYWKWLKENSKEDLSRAIIYANEAIEDSNDPYKKMLIDKFRESEE